VGRSKKRKTRVRHLTRSREPAAREHAGADLAQNKAPALRVTVSEKEGVPQIFADILLMEALGTTDEDFLDGILRQLASAGGQGAKVDERGLNFMLSVIKGVKPRDQMETMLAAQMAAVHMATMTLARRLAHVKTIPQQDSAERAFNKLARTFAAQMEALKRYRSRGDQTVRVEHVTVKEGGQAIVGNVNHGGRGPFKKEEATP
jgi:2-oxoglutarate dehydrogenase complex dehydrogenase (E1) component-like enzyme